MNKIEKQLQEKLGEDLERELAGIACHDAVADLIREKWQGKKVNRRILDQFKERLAPDPAARAKLVAILDYTAGMCNLTVWGFGPFATHSERISLFLGYADSTFRGHGKEETHRSFNALTVEGFEENDCCHGNAAKARNEARRRLVQNGKLGEIAATVEQLIDGKAKLAALCEFGTDGHEVQYDAERLAGIR